MCGRFALAADAETLAQQFELPMVMTMPEAAFVPRYNVAPTQPVTAVRHHRDQRELTFFQWGLIPSWAKDPKMGSKMINARSETVADKPSFRAAFKRRRCIIPASGFYEWQKVNGGKQPMYIHPTDEDVFAFAGLWETWHSADGSELDTCTILTTEPNELMAPIHNRMPVILEREDYDVWLQPGDRPETGLHLLRPFPSQKMAAYPVSKLVNSPYNDSADCIAPLA
jgi:putative SOS response-associated peptidase YedK